MGENFDDVVTLDELSVAVRNSLSAYFKSEVSKEYSEDVALMLLNHFGFTSYVVDNSLEKNERSIFYDLEDAGLLRSMCEEETMVTKHSGRWDIHYWILSKERVARFSKLVPTENKGSAIEL